jgi:sugar/nucleoside kinase (ribokinase family)
MVSLLAWGLSTAANSTPDSNQCRHEGEVSGQPIKLGDDVDRPGGGDAFDAGFLVAWLDRSALDVCLERGLRSAAIVLGQVGLQYRSGV